MTSWPVLDREPIRLPALPGHDDEMWAALLELAELRPGEWTLVGGQMVFLHAFEHGVTPPRVSTDLDVLVNARVVAGGVRELEMAGQLTKKDRQRLRARAEMADAEARAWVSLPPDAGDRGRAVYRLLAA